MNQPEPESWGQRELAILSLIAEGLSNREIAQKLHLSLETIKWYNKQIFAKLGVNSRTQAISAARRLALIQPVPPETGEIGLAQGVRVSIAPTRRAFSERPSPRALISQLDGGRLVGRNSQLTLLLDLWAKSQSRQVHLGLISGEPGIGKTRLANALVAEVQPQGAAILRGGCYEYEATTPYLPFIEALRGWVHEQPVTALRELLGSTASELARLAPEIESKLGPLTPNPPLSPNEERLRLFDNLARFLEKLSDEKGLLLFIDDLHWADQGTLSLLYYLLRNLRGCPIMVLAAYRELELDRSHPLAAALVEWNRERLAVRIALDRLSFEHTSSLLAILFEQDQVTEDFARAIYTETEGNPFFIEEVVKSLIEQGYIYREGQEWNRKEVEELAIPQSVKEAIGRRLDRLSEPCLDILHVASALGKEFGFEELAAAGFSDEDSLLDGLDEAVQAQLLGIKNDEGYVFTHDKIREVLYEEQSPVRRKRLHQRIGEGLEKYYSADLDAHVQELAHHFSYSGDLPRNLRYSIQAAEKASSLYALEDGIKYYECALESAEMLNDTAARCAIHQAIGDLYGARGPASAAAEHYQKACLLEPDPHKLGAIKAKIGSAYAYVGDERGLPYLEQALQELDPQTQANEVAFATTMVARYYHYRCEHRKAIEYLERSRVHAERVDDPFTLNFVYSYLAGAYQHLAEFRTSMEWAQKNIELGEQKDYPNALASGVEFMAQDSEHLGNWQDCLEYARRDYQIGENIGTRQHSSWALWSLAMGEFGLGNLEASAAYALEARSIAGQIGDIRLSILSGGAATQVLSDLGREAEALLLGEQIIREADSLGHIAMRVLARHSLAYAQFYQGHLEPAVELYDQAEALIRPTDNQWIPLVFRPTMAEALTDTGRLDEAASLAGQALSSARASGSKQYEALALRAQSRLASIAGRREDALALIQASIEIMEKLGSRLELARSLRCRDEFQASPPRA